MPCCSWHTLVSWSRELCSCRHWGTHPPQSLGWTKRHTERKILLQLSQFSLKHEGQKCWGQDAGKIGATCTCPRCDGAGMLFNTKWLMIASISSRNQLALSDRMVLWHHIASHLMFVLGHISPHIAIFGTVSGLIKMMGFRMIMNKQLFTWERFLFFSARFYFFSSLVTPPSPSLAHQIQLQEHRAGKVTYIRLALYFN